MGTTMTAALIVGADAFVAHVGDSRAYLFRGNRLERLTRDHTLAQHLVDKGALANIEEGGRFMQHALVNCLGAKHQNVDVDFCHVRLSDGDRLLLCTDGLSDMVNDPEIARILGETPSSAEACKRLVDQALENGGEDNVTAVLARVVFPADSTVT